MYIRKDDLYIKTAPWNLGHGKWYNDDQVEWLQGLCIPTILPDRELLHEIHTGTRPPGFPFPNID